MKVSALVSAYYCSDYLETRLCNLQKLGVEIVVCCHRGSPENVIAARYEPILTYDIPTWGAALNLCIGRATGEYLTIANSDDIFYPMGLSIMAEYLDEHPEIGIVHGDCDLRNDQGIHFWNRPGESVSLRACRVGPMPMWRKALHKDFGFFDETMQVSADYDFWLRCKSYGVKIARVDATVGLYWKREKSLEHRNRTAMLSENAEIRRRYESRFQPQ